MGKYGKYAKLAVDLIKKNEAAEPIAAWANRWRYVNAYTRNFLC